MTSTIDVVVVGAGIVGCAVAYELARRGASVTIVDDRPVGMGATQASAGVLAPYIEAREDGPLLELTARSLDLFDTFVARVTSDSGLPIRYKRTGTLDVASRDEAMTAFRALAARLASRGVSSRMLDRAEVRDREPLVAEDVSGGLYIPCHGFVGAGELTAALFEAMSRHRARPVRHQRVRRISQRRGRLVVQTDTDTLESAAVVVAAGSWAGQIEIEGAARVPVKPIRGQLLHLAWTGSPLRSVLWGERCYLVPWDDGTVLVGATVEDVGFDERATAAGVRDLIDAAADLVPQTWQAAFQAARVGLRPMSPDELPIIGPSSVMPNLMYATAHYRNGVLLAPLTGQMVADAVLDHRLDAAIEITKPERFGRL